MNKTFKSLLALAFMAVAMVFASCSKDDDVNNVPSQKEIESKIIGKWKETKRDNEDVITNRRRIHTYKVDNIGTASHAAMIDGGVYIWDNQSPFTYSISGNKIHEIPDEGTTMRERVSVVANISESTLTYEDKSPMDSKISLSFFTKVTADYTNDIIGLWEGVEMTGYETYGNAEARIEYRADGTYTYYVKDGDNWVASKNVDNEYNVDGDWLASRWRPEAGADYNYEWWDIDEIKDGMMKWSALREKEDGLASLLHSLGGR